MCESAPFRSMRKEAALVWSLRLAVGGRDERRGATVGDSAKAMAAVDGESDAFDDIVMAETRFYGEGYQDGYAEGVHAGGVEGRQYGIQQGARIGSEIGSYLGFALTWQQLLQKTSDEKCSKKIKVLEQLIEMIQNFPLEDPVYDKLQDDLEKIRGRFKQICSLLHIPSDLRLGSEGISFSF